MTTPNSTQIYRWVPASEFKFQENTLYFAENREPGLELYKIAVEYVNRMSINGKEYLKNGKELFWKYLNDWENLYIQEEINTQEREASDYHKILDKHSPNPSAGVQGWVLNAFQEYKELFSTSVSGWVGIDEGKPEMFKKVWCYSKSTDKMGIACIDASGQFDLYNFDENAKITHWIPLPKKP